MPQPDSRAVHAFTLHCHDAFFRAILSDSERANDLIHRHFLYRRSPAVKAGPPNSIPRRAPTGQTRTPNAAFFIGTLRKDRRP